MIRHQSFIISLRVKQLLLFVQASLAKNVELLKKIKGKALIICVLHALKDLQQRGINPDIVVHVDPADLKSKNQIREVRMLVFGING